MTALLGFLNVLLPMVYLLLCGAYYWVFSEGGAGSRRASRSLLFATILLHVLTMVLRSTALGRLPIASPPEFFSMMALSILLLYAVIEARLRVRSTGVVVGALAFVMQFTGSAFATAEAPDMYLLRDPGYALHAVLVLFAYAAMSLSFLYAVLYMVQSRQLRRHSFGLIFRRLPPLDVLERMSVGAAKLAVPLLFVSLSLGHLWMYSLRDKVAPEVAIMLSPYDPKIIASWIVFLVYAVGLLGHQFRGWRGRRMNVLAIAAYISVLLSMGLIHHFFASFHQFSVRGVIQ